MAKSTDAKLIDKYRKKVHTQFPKAFISTVNSFYTIVQEQEDLTLKDILSELCISPQPTILKAWEMAQLSAKTTQNFNRTHPLRLEGMDAADKLMRIEARREKAEANKEKPRKRNKKDIYYYTD